MKFKRVNIGITRLSDTDYLRAEREMLSNQMKEYGLTLSALSKSEDKEGKTKWFDNRDGKKILSKQIEPEKLLLTYKIYRK